jgi:hypothetical protein
LRDDPNGGAVQKAPLAKRGLSIEALVRGQRYVSALVRSQSNFKAIRQKKRRSLS